MTREATTEGFYGVQSAHQNNKLTALQWQAYEVLWHTGPIDKKVLNEQAKGFYGDTQKPMWAAQLKKLELMGLVRQVDKKSWDVTDAAEPVNPPKKPSAKRFRKGIEDIELALVRAEAVGVATPEAKAVFEWLKTKG